VDVIFQGVCVETGSPNFNALSVLTPKKVVFQIAAIGQDSKDGTFAGGLRW